eukprot:g30504.t1
MKLEVMLPDTRDVEVLSDLLLESFAEVLEPWMLPDSLGPVSSAWNWLVKAWEKEVIKSTLDMNHKKTMMKPSLRKPRGWQFEGESVGILLVAEGEIVSFLELCSLPADGRTSDDALATLLMVFGGEKSARPYLQNFCVSPRWRRRGLGRTMLRLAETVVRDVWREDRLYLHAGNTEASRELYRSSGYQMTGLFQNAESLHMSKTLEPETEKEREFAIRFFVAVMLAPAQAAGQLAPHCVMTSASGTTRSGLTFSCVRDGAGWNLEVGALSMADGGVCCIDEFRHLPKEEKTALYEAMEQQSISVAKSGVACQLRARCSIIAAQSFVPNGQSLKELSGLADPLLSRFDLALALRSQGGNDEDVIASILNQCANSTNDFGCQSPGQQSTLAESAYDASLLLEAYYRKLRRGSLGAVFSPRVLESLIRLSRAHARLMQHGSVQLEDAIAVIFLHQDRWLILIRSSLSLPRKTSKGCMEEPFPRNRAGLTIALWPWLS